MEEKGSYDLENAKAQMRKGILEFPVLLIIGSGEVYALDILEKLRETNVQVVEGTLYPMLNRLRRLGLVEYTWKESKNGPPRKYYSLTKEGERVLEQLRTTWDSLGGAITKLLKQYERSN
jgi:PadR family transcriptional regulator PadR